MPSSTPDRVEFSRSLGKEVPASQYKPLRDVIGGMCRTVSGNLTISAGTETEPRGWEKRLHIVLSQDEARDLVESIEILFPALRTGR
jgi:hypothetical protein